MGRYFVTGATGFLGGEIVKQLIGRGHKVAALVRDPAKAALLSTLGVEMHDGDITDRETLRAPMAGADGVFHCAAWYKVGVPAEADRINVDGTRNVLEMMRELGIPRGVYTSTRGRLLGHPGRHARRDLPLRRPAPERVRPHEVARALRGGAADDGAGACRS